MKVFARKFSKSNKQNEKRVHLYLCYNILRSISKLNITMIHNVETFNKYSVQPTLKKKI